MDFHYENAVIAELTTNATYLKPRKNGNLCYHEIIALPAISNPTSNPQEVLQSLAQQYLKKRALHHLVYGRYHLTDKPHLHLLISANRLAGFNRTSFSKADFNALRLTVENYKCHHYPDYPERLYGSAKQRKKKKAVEIKHQRDTQSKKQLLNQTLRGIFYCQPTGKKIVQALFQLGYEFYQRGKHVGIIDRHNGTKYRLKTLGLEDDFFALKPNSKNTNNPGRNLFIPEHINKLY